jgi:hypothetical protein
MGKNDAVVNFEIRRDERRIDLDQIRWAVRRPAATGTACREGLS